MAVTKLECITIEKTNGITWVMLNRPEKRNAMSPQLHYEMDETLRDLEVDPETKVVVIGGNGGYFSAGQDLKMFFRENERNPAGRKRAAEAANRWRWERLYKYDKPTIAMVEGYCVGGAFMQLLATDFAIAAEDTVFSLSEVNWGILPGALVSKVVADTVLPRHALYYCCLGDPFDGKEAERIGMINFAVPKKKLKAETIKLAEKLMAKSPAVLRATKQAVRQVRTMDFDQSYDYLAAKGQAIKVGDPEDSYNTGLRQFLDEKSYKPTFEPFATKDGAPKAKGKKAAAKPKKAAKARA
jgi:feruloyl-CoA hydratase/lyase